MKKDWDWRLVVRIACGGVSVECGGGGEGGVTIEPPQSWPSCALDLSYEMYIDK